MTTPDAGAVETTAAYRAEGGTRTDNGSHGTRLRTLLALEWELGVAEAPRLLRSLAVTLGLLAVGLIVALASLVVLAGGGLALAFAAEWRPLVLAGSALVVLGILAGKRDRAPRPA